MKNFPLMLKLVVAFALLLMSLLTMGWMSRDTPNLAIDLFMRPAQIIFFGSSLMYVVQRLQSRSISLRFVSALTANIAALLAMLVVNLPHAHNVRETGLIMLGCMVGLLVLDRFVLPAIVWREAPVKA